MFDLQSVKCRVADTINYLRPCKKVITLTEENSRASRELTQAVDDLTKMMSDHIKLHNKPERGTTDD